MKTYIVIHNLNSRGKNLSKEYIEDLFKSKNIPYIYFSTSTINELNNVIVEYSDSSKFQYCAIGGDGSLNSLINALMNNGIKILMALVLLFTRKPGLCSPVTGSVRATGTPFGMIAAVLTRVLCAAAAALCA